MTTGRTPRRGAAAAGPIPVSTMRRLRRRAARQGRLPAHRRPAVPTRVQQCGGPPIHHAPARRAHPRARPPTNPGRHPHHQHQPAATNGVVVARPQPRHSPATTVTLTGRSTSVLVCLGDVLDSTSFGCSISGCEASVNSRNCPVIRKATCSPMSTALSPIRSIWRDTTYIRTPTPVCADRPTPPAPWPACRGSAHRWDRPARAAGGPGQDRGRPEPPSPPSPCQGRLRPSQQDPGAPGL
jgi:hypothetical protein